jgi:hypothetical protein
MKAGRSPEDKPPSVPPVNGGRTGEKPGNEKRAGIPRFSRDPYGRGPGVSAQLVATRRPCRACRSTLVGAQGRQGLKAEG